MDMIGFSARRHAASFLLFLMSFSALLSRVASLHPSISTSMFTNSEESDFIYLKYSSHTNTPNASHPGGVYAIETFNIGQIICSPRGHLIPVENSSFFDTSAILTYQVTTPPSPAGSTNASGREYVLVDNTICSRIRFCLPSPGGVGSCGNAVLSSYLGTGMVIVTPTSAIAAGTEIVVELHMNFNLNMDTFQEFCQFDPHGCGIASDAVPPKVRGVLTSDQLLLYLAPSTVPGAGVGVFTKFDIPAYNIVALCIGNVYDLHYHVEADKPERLTAPHTLAHKTVVIQMDNYCGFTNDIIDGSFLGNESYAGVERGLRGPVPVVPGLRYNALQGGGQYRVAAIISTELIPAHSEVLQHYGESYWWFRYEQMREGRAAGRALDEL